MKIAYGKSSNLGYFEKTKEGEYEINSLEELLSLVNKKMGILIIKDFYDEYVDDYNNIHDEFHDYFILHYDKEI